MQEEDGWCIVLIVGYLIFNPSAMLAYADYIDSIIETMLGGGPCALGNLPLPPVAKGLGHIVEDWFRGFVELGRRANDMNEFKKMVVENESPVNNLVIRLMKDMLKNTDSDTYNRIMERDWYPAPESLFKVCMYIVSLFSKDCDPICALI